MMPVHIVRPIGKHERIPVYSTAELLKGVRHNVNFQTQGLNERELSRISRFQASSSSSMKDARARTMREALQAKSRGKFESNKEEIYTMLANGRGVKAAATRFRIGYENLKKYLQEAESI